MKAKMNFTPGNSGENLIEIDGFPLVCGVSRVAVRAMDGSVYFVATPDSFPALELELMLEEVAISADGTLLVNANPVSDEVGLAIYQSLKERYEDPANQVLMTKEQ